MIGIKFIHERANVHIGVGKEPEVGALAAEGECLLSVNSLLMCHLSPESSARRQQKTIHFFCNNLRISYHISVSIVANRTVWALEERGDILLICHFWLFDLENIAILL